MKRVLFAVLILVLAMVACSPAVEVPQETKPAVEQTARALQNGKPFAYVGGGLGHPVISLMMLGFQTACEDYDVDCKFFVGPGFEDSIVIGMQEQANANGASGMVVPVYSPYRPSQAPAIEAGIPLCSYHTPLKDGDYPGLMAWVATDVTQYGKDAADAMADKLSCAGPIAITQNTFNDTENEAARSFTEEMKAKCPGIEVFAPEIEGGEESAAIAKAGAILTAHPDIKGAFGTTGGSPTTWARALEQAGKNPGDVIVIGMDYTRPNLDLVKAGWVYALVGQPIYEETYRCVELLVAHLKGEPVEFANSYPSPIITAADLDKYYKYAEMVDAKLK